MLCRLREGPLGGSPAWRCRLDDMPREAGALRSTPATAISRAGHVSSEPAQAALSSAYVQSQRMRHTQASTCAGVAAAEGGRRRVQAAVPRVWGCRLQQAGPRWQMCIRGYTVQGRGPAEDLGGGGEAAAPWVQNENAGDDRAAMAPHA